MANCLFYFVTKEGKDMTNYEELFEYAKKMELLEDGRNWYHIASNEIDKMATISGVDKEIIAAVIAALSPRAEWNHNLNSAYQLIVNKNKQFYKGFKTNLRKALKILKTKNLEELKGYKVNCFYKNLLGDLNEITIDSHMIMAWYYPHNKIEDTKDIVRWHFAKPQRQEKFRQEIKRLAEKYGYRNAEMQAIIWLAWKHRNSKEAFQVKLFK